MTEVQLTLAIRKYLSGEATEEETLQVEQWYESFDTSSFAFAESDEAMNESTARSLKAIREKISQSQKENIKGLFPLKPERKITRRIYAVAAAAILILISGTALFLLHKKAGRQQAGIATHQAIRDFKPGGNKATLTLGNGKKIILDSSHKGILSIQGNTKVIKMNGGLLAYNIQQKAESKKQKAMVHYNTISTPRGGQYEVILPDGSKIWLNSASSIRFPTAFTGKERAVQMTGEAYFEVAKNAVKPFKVLVKGMTVNVLGTHFNIMAYNDEPVIKTTLLEGAIKVTAASQQSAVLEPGQQAILRQVQDDRRKINLIENANINKVIAWRNNLFWFENDDVNEVMKQLSRWYNVNIVVQGDIPDLFTGSIPRNLTFSNVFEILQKTGSLQYKIENNKTIIVTP